MKNVTLTIWYHINRSVHQSVAELRFMVYDILNLRFFNFHTGCSRYPDVAFVLDISSTDDVILREVDLVRQITHGLDFNNIGARVAMVTFDKEAKVNFHLNDHINRLVVDQYLRIIPKSGRSSRKISCQIFHKPCYCFLGSLGTLERFDSQFCYIIDLIKCRAHEAAMSGARPIFYHPTRPSNSTI